MIIIPLSYSTGNDGKEKRFSFFSAFSVCACFIRMCAYTTEKTEKRKNPLVTGKQQHTTSPVSTAAATTGYSLVTQYSTRRIICW